MHVQIDYRRAGGKGEKGLLTSLGERSPAILRKVVSKSRNDSLSQSPLTLQKQSSASNDSLPTASLTGTSALSGLDRVVRSSSFSVDRRHQVHRKAQSVSPTPSRELATHHTTSSQPLFRARHSSTPVRPVASLPTGQGTRTSHQLTTGTGSTSLGSCRNGQRQTVMEVSSPRLQSLRERQWSDSMNSIDSLPTDWGRTAKDMTLVNTQTDDLGVRKPLRHQHHHSSSPDLYSSALSLSSGGRNGLHHSSLSLSTAAGGSTLSLSTTFSLSAMRSSSSDESLGGRAVMDLYILKHTTDFYQQLCRAWEDVKIVRLF